MKITLPWPPSTNTYWRHPTKGPLAGRHLVSDAGRKYRAMAQWTAKEQGAKRMDGRLKVEIAASPPDMRRRDLDNTLKALLDALTGVAWSDDSQIDDLRIYKAHQLKIGTVEVEWTRM